MSDEIDNTADDANYLNYEKIVNATVRQFGKEKALKFGLKRNAYEINGDNRLAVSIDNLTTKAGFALVYTHQNEQTGEIHGMKLYHASKHMPMVEVPPNNLPDDVRAEAANFYAEILEEQGFVLNDKVIEAFSKGTISGMEQPKGGMNTRVVDSMVSRTLSGVDMDAELAAIIASEGEERVEELLEVVADVEPMGDKRTTDAAVARLQAARGALPAQREAAEMLAKPQNSPRREAFERGLGGIKDHGIMQEESAISHARRVLNQRETDEEQGKGRG
jgi:hypothetical protein